MCDPNPNTTPPSCLCCSFPLSLDFQGSLMDERKKTCDLFGTDVSPAVLCQLVVTAFQPLLGSFQVRTGQVIHPLMVSRIRPPLQSNHSISAPPSSSLPIPAVPAALVRTSEYYSVLVRPPPSFPHVPPPPPLPFPLLTTTRNTWKPHRGQTLSPC